MTRPNLDNLQKMIVQLHKGYFAADEILDVFIEASLFLREKSGEQLIDFIEGATGEEITFRRCDKCPKCGYNINMGRNCTNWNCENKKKKLQPMQCIKLSKMASDLRERHA